MSNNPTPSQHDSFDAMPTEELEAFLRGSLAPSAENEQDANQLLAAMQQYAKRKEDVPHLTAEESLAQFRKKGTRNTKPRGCRRFPRVIRAAVIVLVILLCTVPALPEVSGSCMRSATAYWYDGVLSFHLTPAIGDVEVLFEKYSPTWLPEGYAIKEEHKRSEYQFHMDYTCYEKDGSSFSIGFDDVRPGGKAAYFVDDDTVKEHSKGDIIYYTYYHNEYAYAVFCVDGVECLIGGDIAMEDVLRIFNSINFD